MFVHAFVSLSFKGRRNCRKNAQSNEEVNKKLFHYLLEGRGIAEKNAQSNEGVNKRLFELLSESA